MPGLWFWAVLAHSIIAIFTVGLVLRRRAEPVSMLAWIFSAVTVPFLGAFLYAIFGSNRVRRKAHRKRGKVVHIVRQIEKEARQRAGGSTHDPNDTLDPDVRFIERFSRRLVQIPAVGGNQVRIYNESEETYRGLEEAIRAARHHIHMEYYIWQPDATGEHFRELMIEKAQEKVECRVLLDAVGCWKLPRRFYQPMLDAGVRVEFFLPFFPLRTRRWSLNLRNHRKIAVMDGNIAFMGSQNIGDEYRGRLKRLSPWYDSHMRVCGPASLFLQQTFAEDWVFATGEQLQGEEYFAPPKSCGESLVQILPTGPDQDVSVLGHLAFAGVSAAHKSIRIATPYFVPNTALMLALVHACYRGVKVQIVVPTRTDNVLALWAGRSFYAELLDAGAEIYEFADGLLHSKIISVDDRWCILGSANMDARSFKLNFEISAVMYDTTLSTELGAYIERRCRQSQRITAQDVWSRGAAGRVAEGIARLFSPVL